MAWRFVNVLWVVVCWSAALRHEFWRPLVGWFSEDERGWENTKGRLTTKMRIGKFENAQYPSLELHLKRRQRGKMRIAVAINRLLSKIGTFALCMQCAFIAVCTDEPELYMYIYPSHPRIETPIPERQMQSITTIYPSPLVRIHPEHMHRIHSSQFINRDPSPTHFLPRGA